MNQRAQNISTPQRKTDQAAYARLITPDQVKALSQRSIARPMLDTLGCWMLILLAWAAAAWQPAWWVVVPAFIVIGNRYYALFIIGHDALHRRLFEKRWINDRFADLFVFSPIGAITRLNNRNHLLHHAHLATEHDPDRHKYTCFGKAGLTPLLGFLTGLTSVVRSAKNVFLRRGVENKPGQSREGYGLTDLLLLGTWQLGLIVGLSAMIGWWAYPVLWLAPVYVFAVLADNLRSFCEHSHIESDDLADDHRLITYHSPTIERWLISPMAMNYHTAHHLWPTVPYYRLRQADELLRLAAGTNTGLVWRKSYLGYLWRYMRSLPIDGCDSPATHAAVPAPFPQTQRSAA